MLPVIHAYPADNDNPAEQHRHNQDSPATEHRH